MGLTVNRNIDAHHKKSSDDDFENKYKDKQKQRILRYEDIAFRLIGLNLSHNPGIRWGKDNGVYNDPEFRWSSSNKVLDSIRFSFPNIATMLGRTHLKNHVTGGYYNLNGLDIDCQTVYNRLSVPIRTILDNSSYYWRSDRLRDLLEAFLNESGVVNGNNEDSILDILKKSGYVTKTRKEYGHHSFWLSSDQNPPIFSKDCKPGMNFEIKTNDQSGLLTLPGSTHRDDPDFVYAAVGRTDTHLVSNTLYPLLTEMFKDCLANQKIDDDTSEHGHDVGPKQEHKQEQTQERGEKKQEQERQIVLCDLSLGAVRATAGYLCDFIVVGYRHHFYIYFTGMMFHSGISFNSAFQIVSLLCDMTNDEEKKARIENLRLTYEKGMDGKPLKGATSLADLILTTVKGYDNKKEAAKVVLEILRRIWSKDISIETPDDEGRKKLSHQVIEMLRPRISLLFKDGADTAFAAINTVEGYRYVVPIHKSKRFNLWVRRTYYELAHDTLGNEVLNEVADTLESEALFDGPIKKLEPRLAQDQDDPLTYWYDIGNERRDALRITPDGWSIVESKDVPIVFRRYQGQLPQAIPVRDYPKDIFQQFMKLQNIKDDAEIRLVYQCYVIVLLVPAIAKAVFVVEGPEGAAKTTCQDLTKSVVDPSEVTTFSPPIREDQIAQQLQHNLIVYYDNLSHMPEWLSNALCRAATGTGSIKRELYTDDDDVIYKYKRSIGFNGIVLAANRADLLDRSFIVEIEAVTDETRRLLEGDILPELERIRPQLFGFILDILVKTLKMKARGGIKLDSISRMADFEMHCEMISQCLGNDKLAFVKAYRNNKKVGTKEILENSSVANAVTEYMKYKTAFSGYASTLLDELVTVAITKLKIDVHKDTSWPKSGSHLSRRLKTLKNSLLKAGIQVFWVDNPAENRKTINIVNMQPVQPVQPVKGHLSTLKTDSTGGTGGTGGTFANLEGAEVPPPPTTSPRPIKASWTGDVWACRYCGMKGDKPSMEGHDCPEVKVKEPSH